MSLLSTNSDQMAPLEGWVWRKKSGKAFVPGYKKTFVSIDLDTLELATMRKRDVPSSKYRLHTVLRDDFKPEQTGPQSLFNPFRKLHGLKLKTFHRTLHFLFLEEAECARWMRAIDDARVSMQSPGKDTRKSGMKSILESIMGEAGEKVVETTATKNGSASDKPGDTDSDPELQQFRRELTLEVQRVQAELDREHPGEKKWYEDLDDEALEHAV